MNISKILLFLVCFLIPVLGYSNPYEKFLKEEMKQELDLMKHVLNVEYAPRLCYQNDFTWDLDKEFAIAKERIEKASSIDAKTYQTVLKKLFNSSRDYHVGISFYATEKAFLPFLVKGLNERYFIVEIQPKNERLKDIPIKVGDELVTFDGRPISEVIEEIRRQETRNSQDENDQILAEYIFSYRRAREGQEVPKGQSTIGIIHSGTNEKKEYRVAWEYFPEKFSIRSNQNTEEEAIAQLDPKKIQRKRHFWHHEIGDARGFLPELGRIWWESAPDATFYAYIYENEHHQAVGYIRLHSYNFTPNEFPKIQKEFSNLIELFEKQTDALVIDQMNNEGGKSFLCQELASFLVDRKIPTIKMRLPLANLTSISEAVNYLERASDYENKEDLPKDGLLEDMFYAAGSPPIPEFYYNLRNYYSTILRDYELGKQVSEPIYFFPEIYPDPEVTYTKPILMLINGGAMSCGDIFPSLLQDSHRAILMGTPTAGAGGSVINFKFPNRFGIDYLYYTNSVIERPDGRPLQNVGVQPDIIYKPTLGDLKDYYIDFKEAINQEISGLINLGF